MALTNEATGLVAGHARSPLWWRVGFTLAAFLAGTAYSQGTWEIGYSFDAPSHQTNGLGWDGEALWHTNDVQPIIYRINPDGGEVLETKGTLVPDQGDAEIGGGFLWVAAEIAHEVHKVDPSTGRTVDTIKVLGIRPNTRFTRPPNQIEGVAFDGRNLWVSGDTSTIVKIDLVKRTQHKYTMPAEWGYLDGMTWAFDHLWVVTNNSTIYEVDPCTMGMLDRFDAPSHVGGGPEGFTFDGENLWFGDNDLDRIYKIILKDKILTAPEPKLACDDGILLTAPPTALAAPGESGSRSRVFAPGSHIRFPNGNGAFRDALGRRAWRLTGER